MCLGVCVKCLSVLKLFKCVYVCLSAFVCVCWYVRTYVSMDVCTDGWMHGWMDARDKMDAMDVTDVVDVKDVIDVMYGM